MGMIKLLLKSLLCSTESVGALSDVAIRVSVCLPICSCSCGKKRFVWAYGYYGMPIVNSMLEVEPIGPHGPMTIEINTTI